MKFVQGIVVAFCCATVSVLPCRAQPIQLAPDQGEMSLSFRDSQVSEVVRMIADQGHLTVLVRDGGDVRLAFINLHNVQPPVALKMIARSAHLVLTRVNDTTYILSKDAVTAPATAPVVTPMMGTKPYTIRIRLAGGFTQEIQVQGDDSFTVDSTLANNEWVIRGTNKLEAGVMAIDLQVEWNRGQGWDQGQGRVANRLATFRTQLKTPADNKEITAASQGFTIVVSVRKNAP